MRIPSGTTDQVIYFVAVDATDLKTRETGITLSTLTCYRARNGAAAVAYTTPTFAEVDATNMPGVYSLLLDEDMTIGTGNESEEMTLHIADSGGVIAPVTRAIELYVAPSTAAAIADAVWDEASIGHTTFGTYGRIVDDISQIDFALATTVTAEIGALNDVSTSDLAAALTTYDGPTKAEMDSAFTQIKGATWATTDTLEQIRDNVGGAAPTVTQIWAGLDATQLAKFMTVDSGETIGSAGSVAKIAQGAAGGNVTVGAFTQAALAEMVTDDTGQTTAATGSVALLSQGSGGSSVDWDEAVSDHQSLGTFGALFQTANSYSNSNADIKYITRGDSYDGVANDKLSWAVSKDYTTGWTGTLTIRHRTTGASIMSATVTATTAILLEATLTVSDTAFALLVSDSEFGPHPYDVQMDNGTNQITAVPGGVASIRKDRTTA